MESSEPVHKSWAVENLRSRGRTTQIRCGKKIETEVPVKHSKRWGPVNCPECLKQFGTRLDAASRKGRH